MEDSKQNYELAFHVNPNLEEGRVTAIKEALEQLIVANGGTVTFSKLPEKTRLSYPIRHARASYFGYTQFGLANSSDGLPAIEEHLRLNGDVLRYLVLKLESDAARKKSLEKMAEHKERQERRTKKQPAVTAPKGDEKEIEKQLEEVLGEL